MSGGMFGSFLLKIFSRGKSSRIITGMILMNMRITGAIAGPKAVWGISWIRNTGPG